MTQPQYVDRDEWFDRLRALHPELTREEFDEQWERFLVWRDAERRKREVQ